MRASRLPRSRLSRRRVQAIAEPGRTLELAVLLAVLAARQSDNVLRLVEMRIAEAWLPILPWRLRNFSALICPRLYSMRDRHLHVPRGFTVPECVVGIVQSDVSLEPIRAHWDDLMRLVATIKQGWRTSTDVLERFGSAARGESAACAIAAYPASPGCRWSPE